MLPVNNKIFDSIAAAADGQWRNVSNFGAYSVHFFGLEGTVWIEVSNDPNVVTDGTTISAPSAPTGQAVGATPSFGNAGTWKAKVTYVTAGGETTASAASSNITVANSSKTLEINSPAQDAGGFAVGYNVYISNDGTNFYLQNQTTIHIGDPFVLLEFLPVTLPPSVNTSGQPAAGLNVSGNLAADPYVAPTGANETQVISDITATKTLMYMPSCIFFNFVRVRKTGGSGLETKAFLFGQNV